MYGVFTSSSTAGSYKRVVFLQYYSRVHYFPKGIPKGIPLQFKSFSFEELIQSPCLSLFSSNINLPHSARSSFTSGFASDYISSQTLLSIDLRVACKFCNCTLKFIRILFVKFECLQLSIIIYRNNK